MNRYTSKLNGTTRFRSYRRLASRVMNYIHSTSKRDANLRSRITTSGLTNFVLKAVTNRGRRAFLPRIGETRYTPHLRLNGLIDPRESARSASVAASGNLLLYAELGLASNYAKQTQYLDNGIHRIKFKPAECKILTIRELVVIVLEQLSEQHQIPHKRIL